MNSEKVKEIKKALECCSTLMDNNATSEDQDKSCNECPYRLNARCSWNLDKDALTLINELEKHIERVESERIRIKQDRDKKEELASKFIDSYNDSLKQFAERLKEKLEEYRLENEYFTEHEQNGNLWQMNSSVFCIEVTQDGGLVDETLEDFINNEG